MRTITRLTVALTAFLGAGLLLAPAASASTGCTGSGCAVYKLQGVTLGTGAAAVTADGVALGAPNNAAAGSRLELRNFALGRAAEQFVWAGAPATELQLGGTGLCITGFARKAVLAACHGWASQHWTLSGAAQATLVNARARALFVPSVSAGTKVETAPVAAGSHALWSTNPA